MRKEPNIIPVLVGEAGKLCNGKINRRQHSYLQNVLVDPRDIDWPGFAIGILVKQTQGIVVVAIEIHKACAAIWIAIRHFNVFAEENSLRKDRVYILGYTRSGQ